MHGQQNLRITFIVVKRQTYLRTSTNKRTRTQVPCICCYFKV